MSYPEIGSRMTLKADCTLVDIKRKWFSGEVVGIVRLDKTGELWEIPIENMPTVTQERAVDADVAFQIANPGMCK